VATCSRKISYCAHATTAPTAGRYDPMEMQPNAYTTDRSTRHTAGTARPCAAMRGHAQPCAAMRDWQNGPAMALQPYGSYDLMRIRLSSAQQDTRTVQSPGVTLRAFTMLRLHAPQRPLIGGLHTPTSCIPTGALHPCRGCQ